MKHIPTDEHVFIAGKTGSGKSVLAEVYTAGYTHVIKLDTKGEVYERRKKDAALWFGLVENIDFIVIEKLDEIPKAKEKYKKVIFAPDFENQTQEIYNEFFKYCYLRENIVVWIDELMSVAESPTKYPPYLKAIMTRGRSKNVPVWACTQRPMDIPTIIIANSTHFFIFNLALDQDRDKIARVTGMPEFFEKPREKHSFFYFKDGTENVIESKLKFS